MSRIILTSAGRRHSLQINSDGKWESNYWSPEKKTLRDLLKISDEFHDEKDLIRKRPNQNSDYRIATLEWGLNNGLIPHQYTKPINKTLASFPCNNLSALTCWNDIPLFASTLFWYLWNALPLTDNNYNHNHLNHNKLMIGISDLHIQHHLFHYDRASSNIANQPLGYELYRKLRANESLTLNQYKEIMLALTTTSRNNYFFDNSGWEYELAFLWYEWGCASGYKKELLPNFLEIVDGVDPQKNTNITAFIPDLSYIGSSDVQVANLYDGYKQTLSNGSKAKQEFARTILRHAHKLWIETTSSTGFSYTGGNEECLNQRCFCVSYAWDAAVKLMSRSLYISIKNNQNPFEKSPDNIDFPTLMDIMCAANPNKPGFWRLIYGIDIAFQIHKLAALLDKLEPDRKDKPFGCYCHGAPTAPAMHEDYDKKLVDMLSTLSWHQPTNNELLLHLSSLVSDHHITSATKQKMQQNMEKN